MLLPVGFVGVAANFLEILTVIDDTVLVVWISNTKLRTNQNSWVRISPFMLFETKCLV